MLLTWSRTVPDAQRQLLGDLVVAHAGGEQGQDLALPGRQIPADVVVSAVHHGVHGAAVDGPAPVARVSDGLRQRLRPRVLEQVADGAGLERLLHEVALGVVGQGDRPGPPGTPP